MDLASWIFDFMDSNWKGRAFPDGREGRPCFPRHSTPPTIPTQALSVGEGFIRNEAVFHAQ